MNNCCGMGGLSTRHRGGFVTLLIVLPLLCRSTECNHTSRLEAAEPPKTRAVIRGHIIEVIPFGAILQIPQDWLDWQAEFHNNIHLTAPELAKVQTADTEWDKEYSQIVNAVLPFRSCIIHGGDEGWGRDAVSYGDVQMRAYILECGPQQIAQRMADEGRCQALRFSKKVSVARSGFENWQRVTVSYDLWYGDYGGTANVDLFARQFGKQTAALVFMYSDSARDAPGELSQILKSFKWTP
ncbi:MAG: hypothetical protein HY288_12035 [Planctomycetia bacterium]|nr:hypothetical protein [Planctomycetia bacterium]